MVLLHLAWAHQIAASVARVLPTWFTVDDLTGPAELALIEVAAKYDESRGVPFQAFAFLRVQGACFSSVRRREYRERAHLGIEHAGQGETDPSPSPERLAELHQMRAIWQHVEALPEKHKRVIQGMYGAGMNSKELSEVFGLTEGRISQLHSEALVKLRGMVQR